MPLAPAPSPARNRPWWLLGAGLIVVIIAILLTPVVLIFSAMTPICGNDHVQEFRSPSGKLKAVVFRRDCGATTGYNMNVSVQPATRPLANKAGNVFVLRGDEAMKVHWQDDEHLVISDIAPGRILWQAREFGPVRIIYQ